MLERLFVCVEEREGLVEGEKDIRMEIGFGKVGGREREEREGEKGGRMDIRIGNMGGRERYRGRYGLVRWEDVTGKEGDRNC